MSYLYQFRIITNGQTLDITGGDPFAVVEEDGLAMQAVRRLTERSAQQHGETDRGFLLDPRLVNLVVEIFPADFDGFWQARAQLMSYLAPYNSPALELELSNGALRRLDCHFIGDIAAGSKDRHFIAQKVGLTLRAPDPSWYDPTAAAVTFALGGGGGSGFVVPTPVPTEIGASTISQTTAVNYTGSWHTNPIIRITGPITNPVLTNLSTDEKLDFTGTTIAAGDYYDVDTRYGRKSVVDSNGDNQISKLTTASDLGTFHIAAASAEVPGGVNSLQLAGSSVTTATKVEVTYFNRYLGI